MAAALFACTKCNSRHPFDELTKDQQLCKDCSVSLASVKCTYCRTEFQQEVKKSSTATICKKCEQNVKLYGKPTACEYCNIIAAFIGSKCQRCTNSEKKYGSPLTCDQCKQRCAFDRKDESRKKVDGKLLCWLCTLSYKRALAKAKQNDGARASKSSLHHRSHGHKHSHSNSSHKNNDHGSNKKLRMDLSNGTIPNSTSSSDSVLVDPNSTDHMVALTQLREQIASLQKQLGQKDQQLLAKDKQIAELKAKIFSSDKEMRNKVQGINKEHTDQVQELQLKLRSMQKQLATMSKQNKKGGNNTGNNTDSPLST